MTLRRHETTQTLHDRLAQMAPGALLKAIGLIAAGKAPHEPQDKAKATLTKKLRKEDGHIDWNRSQREIDSHIRAMTPWPLRYAWVPQEKGPQDAQDFHTHPLPPRQGKPGEILRVDRHGILVASKVGGLLLREVQLEGKKRMHAAEFARGFNLPVGLVLE